MADGYLIGFVVALVLTIASRLALWIDLRLARRFRAEPRIGLLAPALTMD